MEKSKAEKLAICVISIGDRPWKNITFGTIVSYAHRVGATPILVDSIPRSACLNFTLLPDRPGRRNKIIYLLKSYCPGLLLEEFDRVAVIDDSCIITIDSENIFDAHEPGGVAAVREQSLRGEQVRKTEEDKIFELIDKFTRDNNLPAVVADRERYVNSGVVVYDKASKEFLSVGHIKAACSLLFAKYPHQALLYYLLARGGVPIQLLPKTFNDMNVFAVHRVRSDIHKSNFEQSSIYHITGWWKPRSRIIPLLAARLRGLGRLEDSGVGEYCISDASSYIT